MNKKVTILIIDDKSQDVNIRALKSQLKRTCDLEVLSICTTNESLRLDDSDHLDKNKLFGKIDECILNRRIDWALTDFDLAETYVDGLDVAEYLAQKRKSIPIIMYSGNITSVIKKALNQASIKELNEDQFVEIIRKLIDCNIVDYVKRDDYKQALTEKINRNRLPTVEEFFLQQLRQHSEMEFKSCYPRLKGKTFGHIADLIESRGDRRTDAWMSELIEQTIAYLVKINE